MSSISDVAAAIKATLEDVPDIGNVFDYQLYPAAEWSTFVAAFSLEVGGVTVLRTATVQYLGERRREAVVGVGATIQRRELDWVVRYHWGLADNGASDPAFRDMLEAIADAIDSNRSLGGVEGCIDHDPVDIDLPDRGAPILLGDVLCHYGEVTFTSTHEQQLTVS